jgi:hypothetical protein
MSVTTTTNARILTTANYLADYDLHHSQPSTAESAPAPSPNPSSSATSGNPANWETQWNRVPAYRPVQNQLDEMRTTYTSEIERNFVRVMFGGEFAFSAFDFLFLRLLGRASRLCGSEVERLISGIDFLLTFFFVLRRQVCL